VTEPTLDPSPAGAAGPTAAGPTAAGPTAAGPAAASPARRPRRRLAIAAGVTAAAITVIGVPAAAFGLTGVLGHGPAANAPMSAIKFRPGDAAKAAGAAANSTVRPAASAASADYHAYVALAGGYSVAEVDVASDTILADSISAGRPSRSGRPLGSGRPASRAH